MAFKKNASTEVAVVEPSGIVASATRITVAEAQNPSFRYTDETWQSEAWLAYDSNGELSYAGDYVGSAYSLVRLTINHVDENGQVQGEVVDEPEVQAIASTVLGGPMMRSDVLRSIGCSFTVAGETYLIGRSGRFTGDEWSCVAPQYVRRWGGKVKVDFGAGVWETLDPNTNVIMRIWTPHPARPLLADSATRSLLVTLGQLAKLRMFMSAELNSRIANGCLYPLPDDLKFAGDAANGIPPGAPGVAQLIFEAMTSNISGYGTAAQIAPIIFEAPVESIKAMKDQPIRFDTPLSDKAMDYRRELIEDLARGLNVPAGQLSSSAMQGMNHWCMPTDVEIFTKDRGWINQSDLNEGDIVLTLDHETGVSQWQPTLGKVTFEVEDLEMRSIESKFHSSTSTMKHRWPIIDGQGRRVWRTSDELRYEDSIIHAAPHGELPSEPKYKDALVELAAWFFTEGTITYPAPNSPQIRIGQSHKANPGNVARIAESLRALFGPPVQRDTMMPKRSGTPTWRFTVEDRGMTMFSMNRAAADILLDVAPGRMVSREFIESMTLAQLELFLTVAALGDGTINSAGGRNINQRNPDRLDAVEYAAILAGHATSRTARQTGGFGKADQFFQAVMTGRHDLFDVREKRNDTTTYTGTIWCPITPNGTWLARSNGKVFFTGNSAWWGTEEFTTKTVAPGFNRVCGALNTAYLHGALKKLGKDPKRYTFGYDLAPLTNSANKLADTLNMFNAAPELISAEEVRRAGNFNDAAKPDQEEVDRRHMWAVVERDPTLLQSEGVRKFLGLDIPDFMPEISALPGDVNKPGPAAPPVPDRAITDGPVGSKPTQPAATDNSKLIASMVEQPSAVISAANALVLAALAVAGRKLRTAPYKNMFRDVPPTIMHTRIKVDDAAHADTLLASAWATAADSFEGLDADPNVLQPLLHQYTAALLVKEITHSRGLLASYLAERGVR